MSFGLTSKDIDDILSGNKREQCSQCDKGYFDCDINKERIALVSEGQFMIQELDEKGRYFMRRFDIKYCPYCGRKFDNRRKMR